MKNFGRTEAVIFPLISFPLLTVMLGVVGFALDIPVQWWYSVLSFFVAIIISVLLSPCKHAINACIVVGIILLSIVIAGLPVMFCVSDAANCYRVGVAMMADGWNPFSQTEVSDLVALGRGYNPWHVAYAFKLQFIFAASLYKCLGFSGVGDSFNIIACCTAFIVVFEWCRKAKGYKRLHSLFIAVLIVCSPYCVEQCLGGKNDPVLYSFFVILLFSMDWYWRSGRIRYLLLSVFCAPLMLGIKATGIISFLVISLIYFVIILIESCKAKIGFRKPIWLLLGIVIGTMLAISLNASPLITSYIKHGTPFYPMRTVEGGEVPQEITRLTHDCDIMNEDAKSLNAGERYIRAYISETLVDYVKSRFKENKEFNPSWPELFTQPVGYGTFFRVIFTVSVLCFFVVRDIGLRIMIAAVLLTTLIVPTKFVGLAHYVQQIYLIPILILLGVSQRLGASAFSKWIMPVIGMCYLVALVLPRTKVLPYIWVCSVQNLQILEAVKSDSSAVIASKYYYGRFLWTHDSCLPIKVVRDNELTEEESMCKYKYGPLARRYDYFTSNAMPSDFYHFELQEVMDKQQNRRQGVEAFFIREFLPNELRCVGHRIKQFFALRGTQIKNAWSKQ